jgi:hypothetical protein
VTQPGTPLSGYPLDLRDVRRLRSAHLGPVGDLERVAGRVIARFTGAQVVLQDDGSADRMPDIRIEYPDRPPAFVEVVADIAPAYAAIARRVSDPSSTWESPRLTYAWALVVTATCHVNDLAPRVVELIAGLESSGYGADAGVLLLSSTEGPDCVELAKLGVLEAYAHKPCEHQAGSIRLIAEGIEGPYDTDWRAVGAWINEVLASAGLDDVRRKLAATAAVERHVFLGVTFSSPGVVFFALERGKSLPPPPTLPTEITHIWLMRATSPGGRCLHWSPSEGWSDVEQRWATA